MATSKDVVVCSIKMTRSATVSSDTSDEAEEEGGEAPAAEGEEKAEA
mgnify:FL=1